jgi:hypothetical protein
VQSQFDYTKKEHDKTRELLDLFAGLKWLNNMLHGYAATVVRNTVSGIGFKMVCM